MSIVPHILKSLEPLFKKHPSLVLDGELYRHELRHNLNDLLSIVKKKKYTKEDLAKSEDIVRYYVYDGYGFDNITEATPCVERREALKKLLKDIKYVKVVGYVIPESETDLKEWYESFVADGYEGAIIRNADAPYQHKRTNDLLKVKPEDDSEAEIMAIHEGNGAWRGCAKTATLWWKGVTEFDATFKCSHLTAENILKNRDTWVGKTVTFKYNGLTGKGVPNFAQIDPNNCTVAH